VDQSQRLSFPGSAIFWAELPSRPRTIVLDEKVVVNVEAVSGWPPDMGQLIATQAIYLGASALVIVLGILAYRRFSSSAHFRE
jgi:hypothetical protein